MDVATYVKETFLLAFANMCRLVKTMDVLNPLIVQLIKLRGLRPRANYNDRAAAAGRRS